MGSSIPEGNFVANFADDSGLPPNVLLVVAGLFLALLLGTALRLALLAGAPAEKRQQRIGSLKAWWAMALIFAMVILLGHVAVILVLSLASLVGLREFLALTAPHHQGRGLRLLAYLAVPLNYLWIYLQWNTVFWIFIPVGVFLIFPVRVILIGKTAGFIQAVAGVTWGLMLIVFCFSHAALLATLPESMNPVGGSIGWFIYLVLLTETDDIAQALWGRKFGKHRVTPQVSPKKTWEGLILGVLSTLVLAVALAPLLTPLASPPTADAVADGAAVWWFRPLLAGFVISIGGFFGDLTMSAAKRDLGVKDTGSLIPGQGGILDRIDSLTFAAPIFFYFVYLLYG